MRWSVAAAQAPVFGDIATGSWLVEAVPTSYPSNHGGMRCARFIKLAAHATERPEGLPGGVT
jgi:hypothetical protein